MEIMACRLVVLAVVFAACLASVTSFDQKAAKCGYDSCNKEKPGFINAHLVAHTHTDPGWTSTVDQYYYRIVQWVLYSLVPALEADPTRRFIYVEMSFFTRWWATDLSDEFRARVKKLINEGRLEIILGGWVMNDEACTHYTAMINQNKRGFEFLRETFGECARPKIGWQIDPFGHSREQASIFAQYGFDGYFFGRLDHQDKDKRKRTHTMEMVWEGSPDNLGPQNTLFTGILPNRYEYPNHLRFDVSEIYRGGDPDPFIHDDPRLYNYNMDKKVDIFIQTVKTYQAWFNTSHVFITMGSDYNYVDAPLNFREMDKLIKYVNARQANGSKINALYSTPSCYLKALNDDERTWTTKQDDFFPYAHRNHSYWTGFFTSRPSSKFFTRRANSFSLSLKKLAGISRVDNKTGSLEKIQALEDSVSLSQHHDAITGTEQQRITYDYAERISAALHKSKDVIQEAYGRLIPKEASSKLPEQVICQYSNVSVCNISQQQQRFEVTVFNSQATPRSFAVRIPVEGEKYTVLASDGTTQVPCDVNPVMPSVSGIRPNQLKPSKNELVFGGDGSPETTVPGLGFKTFFVQKEKADSALRFEPVPEESADPTSIEGDFYKLKFDAKGNIAYIENKKDGVTAYFSQQFMSYQAHTGNNSRPDWQAEGAYVMRPKDNIPVAIPQTEWMGIRKGQIVQEARQQLTDWITQVVRVYKHVPAVEFEWTVGPLPTNISKTEWFGQDIITRYNIPAWGNNGTFYTDSNAREILERKLNYRPTWKANIDEPVAGNYYPINSVIYTKSGDGKLALAVLNDRAEGGSSLNDGDIELNLHRRLFYDDSLGVGEPLDEPGLDDKGLVIRGTHHVIFGKSESIARRYRTGAQDMFNQPLVTFSNSGRTPADYVQTFNTEYSGLKDVPKLPTQVNLLSFERFKSGGPIKSPAGTVAYLVRFEHLFEVKEDSEWSKPVSFDMKDLFAGFKVESAQELALGANAAVGDIKRLVWNTTKGKTPSDLQKALHGTTVTLKPMQITTLQVNFRQ